MLAHLLTEKGAEANIVTEAELPAAARTDCVVAISDFATANLGTKTNFMVRRIKRRMPGALIVVGYWAAPGDGNLPAAVAEATVVSSFADALSACLNRGVSAGAHAA